MAFVCLAAGVVVVAVVCVDVVDVVVFGVGGAVVFLLLLSI